MSLSFYGVNFSAYGLIFGLAAVLVFSLFERILQPRLPERKLSDSVWTMGFIFALLGGLIGARLYHVFTDWSLYAEKPFSAVFQVWNGGLGWYGGLVGVAIGLCLWKRLYRVPLHWLTLFDALAISLPFGQALGRWGNYFNQELFGPPSSLPWAVAIPLEKRPEVWREFLTFHPLFLYESVGTLLLGLGLLALLRRSQRQQATNSNWPNLGSGGFLALYLLLFGTLRFSLDFLRSDLLVVTGLSVSQWLSLGSIALGLFWLQRSFAQWALAIAGVCLLSQALLTAPVQAQSQAAIDLGVVPAVVEIKIQPGKSVTHAFTVRNAGRVDLEATTMLQDFISDQKTGAPVLTDSSQFPYATLINSDRSLNTPYPLKAGGEQQLVLNLNIPEDAPERDWYVVLLTKTKPLIATTAETSQATSQGAIGATIMVRITRQDSAPLQWGLSFPQLPKWFDSLRPLEIQPFVENVNPSLATPELTISIRDWQGRLVMTQNALPERVLAHSSRIIRASQKSSQEGVELEPTEFVFDPAFALGKYTIEGRIANQAGSPLVVEKTIWALPVSITAMALGVALSLGLWRWLQHRAQVRNQEN